MLRLVQLGAWATLPVLALLSLLPKEEMVRTGADGRIEHVVAYAGTMALFALSHGARFGLARLAAALIAYAGLLELGQSFAPGRSPALADFAAGTSGTVIAALLAAWLLPRMRGHGHTPGP